MAGSTRISSRTRVVWAALVVMLMAPLLVAVPLAAPAGAAGAGDLDLAYGINGVAIADFVGLDTVLGSALDGAGRLLAAGLSSDNNGESTVPNRAAIARFLPNGARDNSFSPAGLAGRFEASSPLVDTELDASNNPFTVNYTSSLFYDVATDGLGRIVAVGSVNNLPNDTSPRRALAARFDPSGELDPTFGVDGYVTFDLQASNGLVALAIDGANRVVASGSTGAGAGLVVRIGDSGALDLTFGGGDGIVTDATYPATSFNQMALQSDGRIVVVGQAKSPGTQTDVVYGRFSGNGDPDAAVTMFDADGAGSINGKSTAGAVDIDSLGRIVIGAIASVSPFSTNFGALLRLTPAMVTDASFGGGDGLTTYAGGSGGIGFTEVAVISGDRIVASGRGGGANLDLTAVRFSADGSPDSTFGTGPVSGLASYDDNGNDQASSLEIDADGGVLVVGSNIHFVVVRFLGSPDQGTDPGSFDLAFGGGDGVAATSAPTDGVRDIVELDDGRVATLSNSVDGARWVVDVFAANGAGAATTFTGSTAAYKLQRAQSLVELPDGGLLIVTDAAHIPTGSDPAADRNVILTKLKRDGGSGFVVDGAFGTAGQPGVTISNFTIGGDETAKDALVKADGHIVVVASTEISAGNRDAVVARYLPSGALDPTFNGSGFRALTLNPGYDDHAGGVGITPDGKVVVGGSADGPGGASDHYVFAGRLAENGSNDPTFAGGALFSNQHRVEVGGVAVQQDGRIVIGGSEALGCGGSGTSLYAVRVTTTGTIDTTFGGLGNIVNECIGSGLSISGEDVAIQPNGRIVLAGIAENGPTLDSSVFRLETNGRPDLTFGFRGLQTHRLGGTTDQTGTSLALANDGGILLGTALFPPTALQVGYVSKLIGDPVAAPVVYSPSGKLAITSSRTGRDEVFVVNPDGSSPEQVTNQVGRSARDGELSADASRIVFTSVNDVNPNDVDVYTVNVDGSGRAPLHAGAGFQADPTWSPDGSKVAYANDPTGSTLFDIYIRNANGSGEVKFSEPAGTNVDWDTFPDWSPDGSKIAYQSSPGGPGAFDIKVKPVAGGAAATLASAGNNNNRPKFSPDGTKIAFSSDRDGNAEIYVMNADGTNQTRLTNDPATDDFPEWSPDGALVVFSRTLADGAEELHRVRTDGTGLVQITNTVGRNTAASWIDNLTITTTSSSVSSSPTMVPAGFVPLQGQSSNVVETAGLPSVDLLKSPLPSVDLLKSPLPSVDLLKSGLPSVDLLKSPLPSVDLLKSGLPSVDLLKSPIVNGLKDITLPTTPLLRSGGWKTFLASTRLAPIPEQSLSLYDVLVVIKELHDDAVIGNELLPFTLGELDLSRSRLSTVSPFSIVLLETPIAAFTSISTAEKCRFLAAAGFGQCGVDIGGTNVTLLELQIAGADISLLSGLDGLRVGDIDPQSGAQPLNRFLLRQIDLRGSNLGQLTPHAAPNPAAVVSCSPAECPTLAAAETTNHIQPGATFADLGTTTAQMTLKELTLGFIGVANAPIEQLRPTELGVAAYPGAGSSTVVYTVRFVPAKTATEQAPSLTVDLPEGFTYRAGSATAAIGTGPQQPITPVVTDAGDLVFGSAGSLLGRAALTVRFSTFPGVELGAGRTASVTASGPTDSQTVFNRAPVTVTESFEPQNNSAVTAPLLAGDTVYLSHIATATDRDLYRIHVDQPGTTIRGFLTPGTTDVDLVLYSPTDPASLQLGAPLRAAVANTDAILPLDEGTNLSQSGEPLSPEALQDIVLENRPVVGASGNRGTDTDTVEVVAPFAGDYLVQVSGYNSAYSNDPYALRFSLTPPPAARPCSSVSFPYAAGAPGTLPAAIGANTKTIFLVNKPRLLAMYGPDAVGPMLSRLDTLAGRTDVLGEVWDVSGDAGVTQKFTAWDAASCDPEAANAVVRAINAAVDARVNLANGQVLHLVVVGGDQAMPMARIPDLTQRANERGYVASVAFTGNSSLTAAFERGYQLSDDPYGDARPTPYLNRYLYVSDLGLGRLVETPQEMTRVIDSFIGAGGILDPTTALSAGYDFMGDLARDVDATVASRVPTGADRTLLVDTPAANTRERSFTRSALVSDLTTRTPELASINAHYDHGNLLPAVAQDPPGFADDLYTAGQHAGGPDLTGSIFFTMGCHSGVSVSDLLIGSSAGAESTARVKDWAQAQAAKAGGAYVGQTGYGVGLNATIALSEKILSGFAKNLASGTMTAGQALAFSKQAYLGSVGVYGVYDEKVLTAATMFGLPMWRLGTAAPAPAPASPATRSDPATGLAVAPVTINPTFGSPTPTNEGSFFAIGGQVLATSGRPIQPLTTIDVTQAPAVGVAKDAVITELVSSDIDGFDPVFARPVIDNANVEGELDSANVAFPSSLVAVGDRQTSTGRRQNLVVVPARFQGTGRNAAGHVVGRQRLFSKVTSEVYFSNSTDLIDPDIISTQAVRMGTSTSFVVRTSDVTDVGPGQVKRVLVMAHDESSNVWKKIELVQDPTDLLRWTGGVTFAGELIEYSAQSVDQSGNVGGTWNKALLHDAIVQPAQPSNVNTAIGGTAGSNGWYRSATVSIVGAPTVTIDVQVDGGAPFRYTGPFPVTGDGVHKVTYTTSTGDDGVLYVPVDATPPAIIVTSPTQGATYTQGQSVSAGYSCTDRGSGVASCAGPVADGANIDTASSGTKTFTVNATDTAGNATTKTTQYTVVSPIKYSFEGFFAPVDNPPVLNKSSAGQTIPVKFRLRDLQGRVVVNPATVTAIRSVKIACAANAPVDPINEFATIDIGLVQYDPVAERFQYNWKTDKAWANSCRRLEIEFDDGQQKTALFSFTK